MKKINHTRLFLHALRTALLFVAGFFIYEILVALEKIWNENVPENSLQHFHQRKGIKFVIILIIDLIILYGLFVIFDIDV
jgi:uncharacterized membrane protein YidH (DUF202 family)